MVNKTIIKIIIPIILICLISGRSNEAGDSSIGGKTSGSTEISKDSGSKNHQYDDFDIDEISWRESSDQPIKYRTEDNQQINQMLEFLKGLELEETEPEIMYGVSQILELYQDGKKVAAVADGTRFEIGDKVYIAKNVKQADVFYEIKKIFKDI